MTFLMLLVKNAVNTKRQHNNKQIQTEESVQKKRLVLFRWWDGAGASNDNK